VLDSLPQGDQPFAGFAAELFHSMRRTTRLNTGAHEAAIGEEAG
jgi:hypothetical protein